MARIFTRIGAALAALLISCQPALALVTAPAYLSPSGQVLAAGAFICLNPDTTSCTFGGGGGGGAITAAASSFATGFSPDLGKIGDAACSTDNGAACDLIQLVMRTNQQSTAIIAAINGSIPAGSALIGGTYLVDSGGTTKATVKAASTAPATTDPALVVAQSPLPSLMCPNKAVVSITASTDLITFTNSGYFCSILLVGASAETWGLVEGTGTVCATGVTALLGGATGTMSFAANGGFSAISDRAWLKTAAAAKHVCLLKSGAGNISGVITYADAS